MICQWFIDKWDDGTRSGIVYRLFRKAVQQGRSERRGEEVHTKLRLNRSLRSDASG
jgi:hypothetical protein